MQTKLPSDAPDEIRERVPRLKLWAEDLKSRDGAMHSLAIRRKAATAVSSAISNLERAGKLVEEAIALEAKPIFLGELTSDNQLRYWCPYCSDWHYHTCPPAGVPSLRTSHCDMHSPLAGQSVLILFPEKQKPDATNAGPC